MKSFEKRRAFGGVDGRFAICCEKRMFDEL